MKTAANELPWKSAPDAVACNFALGHLVGNLSGRLTVDGRIHAETTFQPSVQSQGTRRNARCLPLLLP